MDVQRQDSHVIIQGIHNEGMHTSVADLTGVDMAYPTVTCSTEFIDRSPPSPKVHESE